jgi:hypothetical protein
MDGQFRCQPKISSEFIHRISDSPFLVLFFFWFPAPIEDTHRQIPGKWKLPGKMFFFFQECAPLECLLPFFCFPVPLVTRFHLEFTVDIFGVLV